LHDKVDLIVILDSSYKNNILKESSLTKIPTIILSTNEYNNYLIATYKIPGNFKLSEKIIREDFFSTILISIFKKGNKIKNKNDKTRIISIINFKSKQKNFSRKYKKF
jgi:ribosomal protein S2